jgi:hypothetical protein
MKAYRILRGRRSIVMLAAAMATTLLPSASGFASAPACGAWKVVPSPDMGSNGSTLSGVSSPTRNDAWAVGSSFTGSVYRTLAEHWDGTSWVVVSTPNVGSRTNSLTSVVATSANDAMAVGFYDDGSTFRTLAMRWNGLQWSLLATPNVGAGENVLESVTVAALGDVWAAGYRQDSFETARQTLALHWNGSAWSVVATPNGTGDNCLWSVRARTPVDVWAVGSYSAPWFQTLAEHWDGTSWTVVPSQNLGTGDNVLYAAVPLTASQAVGVGTWLHGNQTATLTEHWSGGPWTAVPSPSPAGYLNFLTGAAASGPSDIWAVGRGAPQPFTVTRTLAEHWNGHAWTVARTPNVGTGSNQLAGVAQVIEVAAYWAVGSYDQGGVSHTLTEFRC